MMRKPVPLGKVYPELQKTIGEKNAEIEHLKTLVQSDEHSKIELMARIAALENGNQILQGQIVSVRDLNARVAELEQENRLLKTGQQIHAAHEYHRPHLDYCDLNDETRPDAWMDRKVSINTAPEGHEPKHEIFPKEEKTTDFVRAGLEALHAQQEMLDRFPEQWKIVVGKPVKRTSCFARWKQRLKKS